MSSQRCPKCPCYSTPLPWLLRALCIHSGSTTTQCTLLPPGPFLSLSNQYCQSYVYRIENTNMKKSHLTATGTNHTKSDTYYFVISTTTVASSIVTGFIMSVIFCKLLSSSAIHLHNKMFRRILHAPLVFFEENPIGLCFHSNAFY